MAITWKIDPSHSEIQFKVRHLMVTNVTGYFRKFDLTVETETDDFNTAKKIEFTADLDSIETNSEQRDTHLKSDDFFNAEKFKQLKFVGKEYKSDGDKATLTGDLTIRDVTRPIKLNVEFGGSVVDPYGQNKAGFTVTGKISRKEYGLLWNAVTEAGQVVASDDIRINCEIQLVKQNVEEAVEEEATV
ncbi:MAG: YceI family protein [Chitinophagaceae bacterium]|nr:YceI family protein [Chitinophagaceae bacterium]